MANVSSSNGLEKRPNCAFRALMKRGELKGYPTSQTV